MVKFRLKLFAVMLAAALLFSVTACQKKKGPNDGLMLLALLWMCNQGVGNSTYEISSANPDYVPTGGSMCPDGGFVGQVVKVTKNGCNNYTTENACTSGKCPTTRQLASFDPCFYKQEAYIPSYAASYLRNLNNGDLQRAFTDKVAVSACYSKLLTTCEAPKLFLSCTSKEKTSGGWEIALKAQNANTTSQPILIMNLTAQMRLSVCPRSVPCDSSNQRDVYIKTGVYDTQIPVGFSTVAYEYPSSTTVKANETVTGCAFDAVIGGSEVH